MDGSRMKGLKMTVIKDIDIIRYVKKEMMKGELGQFIELNVYVLKKDGTTQDVFKYDERNIDNLPPMMFDLSITRRIVAIYAYFGFWEHRKDNGGHSAIIGFDIMVDESKDGQTNITAKLLDFFNLLVTPWGLEKLKEPFNMNYWKMPEITSGYGSGQFIMMPPPNIWEWLEADEE